MSNASDAPASPSSAPDTLPAPSLSPQPSPASAQPPAHSVAAPSVEVFSDPSKFKLTTWVKGGTTTSAFDKELAQKVADANARREEDEKELRLGAIPIEQGGALTFTRKLADPLESPRVLIKYVGRGKDTLMEQLCELVVDDVSENHMLVFVCPECFTRGIPSQFCQLHARNAHRAWHLDTRGSGTIRGAKNSDSVGGVEAYTDAGKIMDTDILGCTNPNCGAKFKIHNNIMYRVD